MSTVVIPAAEQRVVLQVSWETYERLLAEHPDTAGPRFTYNEGWLEIMVLSAPHEQPNRILARLVEEVATELGVDVCPVGSTTFRRKELGKGFEPDSAYYIGRESSYWDPELDPTTAPAPDLIIGIEVSRTSLERLPIFAAFGVPEVWRYDGSRVSIWRLEREQYVKTERSIALPPLNGTVATDFLSLSRRMRSAEWLKRVREWARKQR